MAWTDSDDDHLKESEDRLLEKQKELESQLIPIKTILNNIAKIKSREFTSYNEKRELLVKKIKPKDKWGKDMTDKDRLKTKDECIEKTNELLGE